MLGGISKAFAMATMVSRLGTFFPLSTSPQKLAVISPRSAAFSRLSLASLRSFLTLFANNARCFTSLARTNNSGCARGLKDSIECIYWRCQTLWSCMWCIFTSKEFGAQTAMRVGVSFNRHSRNTSSGVDPLSVIREDFQVYVRRRPSRCYELGLVSQNCINPGGQSLGGATLLAAAHPEEVDYSQKRRALLRST
jgi:hypothetical protein